MEKVTINDIARLTGLSKGTVDRVLHNRGEVSKKSYQEYFLLLFPYHHYLIQVMLHLNL